MSRARDNWRMYGPPLVAAIMFAIAAAQYAWAQQWERFLVPMACATFGFACTAASDEVADWTGRYRWTYDSFWTYPPSWIRVLGFGLLIYASVLGFRR
jgi:hypothetical protein